MRIRHVACLAPPRLGGIGAAALRLCEGLEERGHTVELVVPEGKRAGDTHPLIKPRPAWFAWGNAAVLKRPRDLFADIDVLHLHYPFYGTAERLLWPRPPVPTVVTFHMDAAADDWRETLFLTHRRFVQPHLFRRADRLLVSSFDYARASSAASSLARDPARWVELPFFVDEARFCPGDRPPADSFRALFVGALDRAHLFKGIRVVLDALPRMDGVHLTIVGDGESRPALQAEIGKRGLGERVTFTGRLPQEDLIRAYQVADTLLFPSTSRAEAFGLVALEAQACGTPVIASDLPGVRTVVRDGETGILVAPGSVEALVKAVEALRDDPVRRAGYGLAARAHVEAGFRRDTLLDRLEAVYRDVCASR